MPRRRERLCDRRDAAVRPFATAMRFPSRSASPAERASSMSLHAPRSVGPRRTAAGCPRGMAVFGLYTRITLRPRTTRPRADRRGGLADQDHADTPRRAGRSVLQDALRPRPTLSTLTASRNYPDRLPEGSAENFLSSSHLIRRTTAMSCSGTERLVTRRQAPCCVPAGRCCPMKQRFALPAGAWRVRRPADNRKYIFHKLFSVSRDPTNYARQRLC